MLNENDICVYSCVSATGLQMNLIIMKAQRKIVYKYGFMKSITAGMISYVKKNIFGSVKKWCDATFRR